MKKRKITLVDPPSGWKYGFPKELPEGKDYEELLRESKYPEKDIPLALTYSRWQTEEVEDE
jgi:hypothetical protein